MYKDKKIVCIIPARSGSKGLPGKNIKMFSSKPLIAHSIEQAKKSGLIDRIIVSTDDKTIKSIALKYGAEAPFLRPKVLSRDKSSVIPVLLHAMDWIEKSGYFFDVLVLLHTTAPLRHIADINNCIRLLIDKDASSVFSVSKSYRNPYFNMVELVGRTVKLVKKGKFATRQQAPLTYDMNASIYVWQKDILKKERKIVMKKSLIYIMPKERSMDIDDYMDFKIAEVISREIR